ncbi:unnamed protein product, partial [Brassica napus]
VFRIVLLSPRLSLGNRWLLAPGLYLLTVGFGFLVSSYTTAQLQCNRPCTIQLKININNR